MAVLVYLHYAIYSSQFLKDFINGYFVSRKEMTRMTSLSDRPDIFNYNDYRNYLKDMYSFHKTNHSVFSYRYIAQKVLSGSTGWFPNIISGRIALTDAYTFRLGKLFGIRGREFDYFNLLVKFGQTVLPDEKEYYIAKMYEFRGEDYFLLGKPLFDYYRHWYIGAIRELLMIIDDDGNPEKIASLLLPNIDKTEAHAALLTLRSLGLVYKTANGKLRPKDEIVRKDPAFASVLWAANMEAKLNLALKAISSIPKDQRDFSEVVVPLSDDGIKEVEDEVNLLRKKILSISKKDQKRNRVYQCSIQIFPLSNKTDKGKE